MKYANQLFMACISIWIAPVTATAVRYKYRFSCPPSAEILALYHQSGQVYLVFALSVPSSKESIYAPERKNQDNCIKWYMCTSRQPLVSWIYTFLGFLFVSWLQKLLFSKLFVSLFLHPESRCLSVCPRDILRVAVLSPAACNPCCCCYCCCFSPST